MTPTINNATPELGSHGANLVASAHAHRGASLPIDLLEHPGRSVLNCGSLTSKAQKGSGPSWVQIPPLPPTYQATHRVTDEAVAVTTKLAACAPERRLRVQKRENGQHSVS